MKDYLLQIKIKNGPMMSIMRANNINTAAELARVTKVTPATVGSYLNLKKPPLRITGQWTESILRIAECLKVPPEMLFPEQHLTKALKDNVIEGEVSLGEMKKLVSTAGIEQISETIEKDTQDELHDRLERGWGALAIRERKVLELRFGINQGAEEVEDYGRGLEDNKEMKPLQQPYKTKEKTAKQIKKDQTMPSYAEVGEMFSVTGDRIRQIEAKALRKLRHPRHNEENSRKVKSGERNNSLNEEP